jgi:hypothetical protein
MIKRKFGEVKIELKKTQLLVYEMVLLIITGKKVLKFKRGNSRNVLRSSSNHYFWKLNFLSFLYLRHPILENDHKIIVRNFEEVSNK